MLFISFLYENLIENKNHELYLLPIEIYKKYMLFGGVFLVGRIVFTPLYSIFV